MVSVFFLNVISFCYIIPVFHGINASLYDDRLSGFPTPYSSRYEGLEIDMPFEADPVTERSYINPGKIVQRYFVLFNSHS